MKNIITISILFLALSACKENKQTDNSESTKEVMQEAKGRGYDVKVIRKIVAIRKRNRDDIENENAITEMYMEALGM